MLVVLFALLSIQGSSARASAPETDSARLARIIDEYWHYPLLGTFYARYLAGKQSICLSGPMPLKVLDQHVH